ncbi:NAD(P)-dependent oxidoreductase [Algirhabdus cladophorae]|uniref:NAD(P)-dependent oxidoreductase n=1 Tax=Algirhabdus cladophorae TaxID=3377108 RepID=UPI003B846185
MAHSPLTSGVVAGRLDPEVLADNFSDLHAPLQAHEASVAADRCYFCHDAPCVTACPTDIDVPLFIRQIQTGTAVAAGKTILEQNILGGMCARVCPTETLCEQACVREAAEGKPVQIGQLQRFATDAVMAQPQQPFTRAPDTGKRVAVVGAGPAGLAAAHRLALLGHQVDLYDATDRLGGLNQTGIAAYKSTDDFAQAEVEWLLEIGGIEVKTGFALGQNLTLSDLTSCFEAVFLAIGLGGVNALSGVGETRDAVDFIEELRLSKDLAQVEVGRDVLVVGGGMTAVDAAVQSKLLGADRVTIAYRRGQDAMSASRYEQDLATSKGVRIVTQAVLKSVDAGQAVLTLNGSEEVILPCDQVLMAIGQKLDDAGVELALEGGKIAVKGAGRTSAKGVWAGGDCAAGGEDLTVTAVAEGRDAAMDIHSVLMGN